jgi:hypothetical protein
MPTHDDREAQILALWRDRPPERRSPEHVILFYDWLVAYAPWLLPRGAAPLDRVRSMVEAHTVSPEKPGDTTRERRQK